VFGAASTAEAETAIEMRMVEAKSERWRWNVIFVRCARQAKSAGARQNDRAHSEAQRPTLGERAAGQPGERSSAIAPCAERRSEADAPHRGAAHGMSLYGSPDVSDLLGRLQAEILMMPGIDGPIKRLHRRQAGPPNYTSGLEKSTLDLCRFIKLPLIAIWRLSFVGEIFAWLMNCQRLANIAAAARLAGAEPRP
jgi:hypothetical protein